YHAELRSWISIQTGISLQPEQAEFLVAAIEASLSDVRAANSDYDELKRAATYTAEALRSEGPDWAQDVESAARLLEWMRDDNFVFLGYREYELATNEHGQQYLAANMETGL